MKSTFLEVLKEEGRVLSEYKEELDDLDSIIELILNANGKIVFTGVGKSGLVATKISATFSSIGISSFFIHPTEIIHGDLGALSQNDIVIAISYSGESSELNSVISHIKNRKIKIITMSGNNNSSLAKFGDYFLSIKIPKEACPINIIPTTSTTLTLAMGDALAICLMKKRNFTKEDFAHFHPGGSLGRNLFMKIKDIMQTDNMPLITQNVDLKYAIEVMTKYRLGNAIFVDENQKILGVLSDGDLRRAMMDKDFNLNSLAFAYCTKNPKIIKNSNLLAIKALELLKDSKIQLLIITDENNIIKGVIHIHMLIQAGFKV